MENEFLNTESSHSSQDHSPNESPRGGEYYGKKISAKKDRKLFWIGLAFLFIVVFFTLQQKEYSFLLVLSSISFMGSFFVLAYKIFNYTNSSGVSWNSVVLYFFVILTRLFSTLIFNQYQPHDFFSRFFYNFCLVGSLVLVFLNKLFITKFFNKYSETEKTDYIGFKRILFPCLILSWFFHPNLDNNKLIDSSWAASNFIEALAIYPQLKLKYRKHVIEDYTSHYIALQGVSRILSLLYWWNTFEELSDFNFGVVVVGSHLLQIVLMLDFYFSYFKYIIKNEKIVLRNI